jgi:hypothetical protein
LGFVSHFPNLVDQFSVIAALCQSLTLKHEPICTDNYGDFFGAIKRLTGIVPTDEELTFQSIPFILLHSMKNRDPGNFQQYSRIGFLYSIDEQLEDVNFIWSYSALPFVLELISS